MKMYALTSALGASLIRTKLMIFPDSALMSIVLFILWSITVRGSVVTKVHAHKWKEARMLRVLPKQLSLFPCVLQRPFTHFPLLLSTFKPLTQIPTHITTWIFPNLCFEVVSLWSYLFLFYFLLFPSLSSCSILYFYIFVLLLETLMISSR